MAYYSIKSLNYASSGRKRLCLNMDVTLGYEPTSGRVIQTEDEINDMSAVSNGEKKEIYRGYLKTDSSVDASNQFRQSQLKNKSYILDIQRISKTQDGDQNALKLENGDIMNPMYDITDTMLKSYAYKQNRAENPNIPGDDARVDTFSPTISADPIGFCNFKDKTILLTQPVTTRPVSLNTNLKSRREEAHAPVYSMTMEERDIEDIRYLRYIQQRTPVSNVQCSSYSHYLDSFLTERGLGTDSDEYLSAVQSVFADRYRHSGIEYNYIFDIDQSNLKAKYKEGCMPGQMIPAKNSFNSLYSQETNSVNRVLKGRRYAEVNESGGDVYLKFYDNADYTNYNVESIENRNAYISHTLPSPSYIPYQKIESLKFVKNESQANHKSNLFSINLYDTGLDGVPNISECNKQGLSVGHENIIKQDIENAIKEIVQNIAPANTQLFKTFFYEE